MMRFLAKLVVWMFCLFALCCTFGATQATEAGSRTLLLVVASIFLAQAIHEAIHDE